MGAKVDVLCTNGVWDAKRPSCAVMINVDEWNQLRRYMERNYGDALSFIRWFIWQKKDNDTFDEYMLYKNDKKETILHAALQTRHVEKKKNDKIALRSI